MPPQRPLFSRRLQAFREAAGISQYELARRCRLSRQALSRLELGQRQPAWGTVCLLARALDVSVAAFAGETAGTLTPPDQREAMAPRLLRAARAYARAYDQLEQRSRGADGGSVELFARFQDAQVELNLAALDSFAGPAALPAEEKPTRRRQRRAT